MKAYGRPRDRREVLTALEANVNFIDISLRSYLDGYHPEALRIATSASVIVDNGKYQTLIEQLALQDSLPLISTLSEGMNERNRSPESPLVIFLGADQNATPFPLLAVTGHIEPDKLISLPIWLNETVLKDGKKRVFTRAEIIKFLRNKEGGAHFDPVQRSELDNLVRGDTAGFSFQVDDSPQPLISHPIYATMAQIGAELVASVKLHFAPPQAKNLISVRSTPVSGTWSFGY